eukprot:TRINITY_DN5429_c0_g1_i9.p1 TRINITY_DN5429_c0_g1~~TRINITY_DN5429_c0_g1_i9.p1  ORF type:complete len:208 (+),score=38.71 TRINITY_DN5429_c0_g1_i9:203-826(+)
MKVILLLAMAACLLPMTSCEEAIFSGGCFWKLKDVYAKLDGVEAVVLGYIGGWNKMPSQEDVIVGKTGHAESVMVKFKEDIVSYRYLLKVFWRAHDATLIGSQGLDVGTQFRSALWPLSREQYNVASASMNATHDGTNPIRTTLQLTTLEAFQPANMSAVKFHCRLADSESIPTSAQNVPILSEPVRSNLSGVRTKRSETTQLDPVL